MRRTSVLLVAILSACGAPATPARPVSVVIAARGGPVTIRAEVAATLDQRERGLMGRRSLAPDTGMLFVFPGRVRVGFWMKDTLIPLDVAFIAGDRIVEVDTMTPCTTADCPLTTPAVAYDRALEVTGGLFTQLAIGTGAAVKVIGTLPDAS